MQEVMSLVEQAMAGYASENLDEDRKSLIVAAGMLHGAKAHGVSLDEMFIERAAEAVHDAWLSRNASHASESEQRSYGELSEEDKEKDRAFVKRILAVAR